MVKWMLRISVGIIAVYVVVAAAISALSGKHTNTPDRSEPPVAESSRAQGGTQPGVATVPPPVASDSAHVEESKPITGNARFGTYRYSWQRTGERVAATFAPRMLPRNDAVVIGAMRHVAMNSFNADLSDAQPELVPSAMGVNVLRFVSAGKVYDFTIIKEDTGEVHSFVIERQ